MFSKAKTKQTLRSNIEFQSFADCFSPKLQQFFQKFPIHSLQIVVPGLMKMPESITEKISHENEYFLIQDLPPVSLIDHTLIEAFLKKGSSIGLSINSRAGIHNFAGVLPTGHVTLSLQQEIFESLDLIEDHFNTGRKKKRKVAGNKLTTCMSINTMSATYNPSKKNYGKLIQELEKINSIRFDLIFSWIPHDQSICPTSVQKYFQDKGFTCSACECRHVSEPRFSVKVPKISFPEIQENPSSCSQWDFLEWVEAQVCGIQCEENNDGFVSSYAIPEPFDLVGKMFIGTWTGLIPSKTICNIFKSVDQVFSQNREVTFVTLLGHGFQDSWVVTENQRCIISCDKMLCVVIFPDLSCWLYIYIGNESINY